MPSDVKRQTPEGWEKDPEMRLVLLQASSYSASLIASLKGLWTASPVGFHKGGIHHGSWWRQAFASIWPGFAEGQQQTG